MAQHPKIDMKELERSEKYGYFTGKLAVTPLDEYERHWFTYKRLYLYEADPKKPLTFHHPDGYLIRPDKKFKTDMGSVPLFLQWICSPLFAKDRWLRSYLFHDSAYCHKGLWFAKHDPNKFEFCKISRKEADGLLKLMIKSQGGNLSSPAVRLGVRIGGRKAWKKKEDLRKVGGTDGNNS